MWNLISQTNTWGYTWTISWTSQQTLMCCTGIGRLGSVSYGGWDPSIPKANSSWSFTSLPWPLSSSMQCCGGEAVLGREASDDW